MSNRYAMALSPGIMTAALLSLLVFARSETQAQELPDSSKLKPVQMRGRVKLVKEQIFSIGLKQFTAVTDSLVPVPADASYTVIGEEVRSYDKEGYLLQEGGHTLDEKKQRPEAPWAVRYHFDSASHRLLAMVRFRDKRMADSVIFDYSRKGRLDGAFVYDSKGRKKGWNQYTYDQSGRLLNIRLKDQDFGMRQMIRFSYNDQGLLKERRVLDQDLKVLSAWQYGVDSLEDGRVQHNCYEYQGAVCTGMTGYVTDAQNNIVERSVADSSRKVTDFRKIRYNKEGLPVHEQVFAGDETVIAGKYLFDSKGNWVERIEYRNWVPVSMVRRDLEYYDEL